MNRLTTLSRIDTDALERETGFGWGWFMVLGAALIVLGALAFVNLPPAHTVSMYAVGIFMLIGAFAQLGTTLLAPGWRGIGVLVLSAILYGAAGILVIVNPTLATEQLTLLLALALIFSGIMRIRLTSVMPSLPGRGWVAASGFVSVVSGLVFIHFLLAPPVWRLGVVLAVDLTFQGAMTIAFGLALKAIPRAISFHGGTMKASSQSLPCNVPDTAGSASAEAYAAGFCARTVLRDGTPVCVRAIRRDDKERMRVAFERLSRQSIYRRFFQHLTALTSGALREATELDFRDHVGLALTVGEGTSERLIAVGEFVRVTPGADCAEVAFVVGDDYQHRGAATLLLQHLVHVARGLGVRDLLALVLEDNREMLEVLGNSGLPLRQTVEDGMRRVVLSLETAP